MPAILLLVLLAAGIALRWVEDDRVSRSTLGLLVERLIFVARAALPALMISAALCGAGCWLAPRSRASAAVALGSIVAGMGIVPLLACTLASIGCVAPISWVLLFALLTVAGVLTHELRRSKSAPTSGLPLSAAAALVPAPLLGIALVFGVVGALTPALLFDVTEYHLGTFPAFAAAGRLVPLPHNFYGRFPSPVQLLYDAGLWMEGGGWWRTGATDFTPKFLNLLAVAGCGFLAALWARLARVGWPLAGIAALLTVAHPVMLEVTLDAYIDAPVALAVGTAAYLLHRACHARLGGAAWLPLAGAALGAALTTKYTVLQIHLLPLVAIFAAPAALAAWRHGGGAIRRRLLIAVALAGLPLAAWLVRNLMLYGNPTEPFLNGLFRPGDAIAKSREAFYVQAHFPQSIFGGRYWSTLPKRLGQVLDWPSLACAAFVLLPGAAYTAHRVAARPVFLWILAAGLLWNTVGESQQRFLLPLVAPGAALAVAGLSVVRLRAVRVAAAALLILLASSSLLFQGMKLRRAGAFGYALTIGSPGNDDRALRDGYIAENVGALGRVLNASRAALPANARVISAFEARAYLMPFPFTYSTVWDADPLVAFAAAESRRLQGRIITPEELQAGLIRSGYTHILINRQELARYVNQYAVPAQLREVGLDPQKPESRSQAYFRHPYPEELYPPYYRDAAWRDVRGAVIGLLRRAKPVVRSGPAGMDVVLASLTEPLTP